MLGNLTGLVAGELQTKQQKVSTSTNAASASLTAPCLLSLAHSPLKLVCSPPPKMHVSEEDSCGYTLLYLSTIAHVLFRSSQDLNEL